MLVASGDHRFLTGRGWKHVTGSEQGQARRPHLTINNKLMGTGGFAPGPKGGADYRRGYLCGMIRGDGHLGSYSYDRPGRSNGDVFRFRLALVDDEGLERTQTFLADMGVQTKAFLFSEATATTQAIERDPYVPPRPTSSRSRELVRWPRTPSQEWCKGFLAGLFDAEGEFQWVSPHLEHGRRDHPHRTASCLRLLEVRVPPRADRSRQRARQRPLAGWPPRGRALLPHASIPRSPGRGRSKARRSRETRPCGSESIEPLGFDLPMVDITTGTGDFIADGVVSHNCFARPTHTYLDMNAGSDFETKIVVKVNAPEVLRRQLAAKRWKGEGIAMGTNTDPYQRAEGRYRLMPGIIRALTDYRNPFSILTKGTLILRDLELLVEAAAGHGRVDGVLDRDARRGRLAQERARHPAPARAHRGRSGAERGRHPVRRPDGADPARASPTTRASSGRWSRRRSTRARPTSRRSCCTCAPACARSSCRGSRTPTPTSSNGTRSSTASPTRPRPNAMRWAVGSRR